MQIDASQIIRDFRGNAMQNGEEDLTLGDAIMMACLKPLPEDAQAPGQAVKAFKIAKMFADGGTVEITTEDAAFIKSRIEKVGAPLVVGRVHEMLEQ